LICSKAACRSWASRRIGKRVQGGIIRAEPTVDELYPVALAGRNDLSFKEWVGRARGLYGFSDRASETGNEGPGAAIGLGNTTLKDHRGFGDPPRRDDANARAYVLEPSRAKDRLCCRLKRPGPRRSGAVLHDGRHVLSVQLMYLLHGVPECEQGRDNGAGAGAEDEIESFEKRAADHALDLT
jgi:hypothetical protein